MSKETVQSILENRAEYRNKLFARGFYFTDDVVDTDSYPFYGEWKSEKLGNYQLLVSAKQHHYIRKEEKVTWVLIGHAYDPISMISDEHVILQNLGEARHLGSEHFWNQVNQLTGIFTLIWLYHNRVYIIGDPTCMQTTFYGMVDGHLQVSSHTALLGDLLKLEEDDYVKRLRNYRFFHLLGNALPGDLSPYQAIRRMTPNHVVIVENGTIRTKRFYIPHKVNLTEDEIAEQVAELLHNNLLLIPEKWQKPAISMTGGCDSKTTMACAEGVYDKYRYFSYDSSESERVDAEAAGRIAEKLGLTHVIYPISNEDSDYQDIEIIRDILNHNSGDIIPHNRNDVRKRAFFADTQDFDVEVKSWASEIGRSYYSKRFHGRTDFGKKPTPRKCTTMYKFFLHNRKLVRETDAVFKEYLKNYFVSDSENPVEWQEQFFWEYRVPSWNGLVITGEHRYSFDITIPYNNRILLNLLLSAPIESRISDSVYEKIRTLKNPLIDETGIAVQNLKHTKRREQFENIYYTMHSLFPF